MLVKDKFPYTDCGPLGPQDLEQGKRNLDKFVFVGLNEMYDTSMVLLGEALAIPLQPQVRTKQHVQLTIPPLMCPREQSQSAAGLISRLNLAGRGVCLGGATDRRISTKSARLTDLKLTRTSCGSSTPTLRSWMRSKQPTRLTLDCMSTPGESFAESCGQAQLS